MPEEGWDNHYENHDIIRLDCSRFIWPKYSFIRKCTTNYFDYEKKKDKKAKKVNCIKCELNEKNVNLENKHSENVREFSALYQTSSSSSSSSSSSITNNNTSKSNQVMNQLRNTSMQAIKSENRTNYSKNSPMNNLTDIGKKRNRDVIYSDEEGSDACDGSDDDQCGNALFFQVSKYGLAVRTVRTVCKII